jgi:hypothetical protein
MAAIFRSNAAPRKIGRRKRTKAVSFIWSYLELEYSSHVKLGDARLTAIYERRGSCHICSKREHDLHVLSDLE